MKRTVKAANTVNTTDEGSVTMKRTVKAANTVNTTDKGSVTMKRTVKAANTNNNNNSSSSSSSSSSVKETTMKRTSKANTVNSAIDPSQLQALFAQFLATQAQSQAQSQATKCASESEKATREKAAPVFEMVSLKGCFKKSLYSAPLTKDAAQYFGEMKSLCNDVLSNLTDSPLVREIKVFATAIEKDASKSVTDFALGLLSRYTIPMQSMRVILQLVCPVMCVCCTESDTIARRGYGLSRANALMGSACNEVMYRVCREGKTPIPFKRVAYNFSALGLNFSPCESVGECDFCASDEGFTELVTLCQSWIDKCESKEVKVALTTTRKREIVKESVTTPAIDPTALQDAFAAFLKTYKG